MELLIDGNRGIYMYQQLAKTASKKLKDAIIKEIGKQDFEVLESENPFSTEEYHFIVNNLLDSTFWIDGKEYIMESDGDLFLSEVE